MNGCHAMFVNTPEFGLHEFQTAVAALLDPKVISDTFALHRTLR